MPISSPVVEVRLAGRDGPGQPEVGDLDPPVVAEQHVLGLDVAVHDAGPVRRGQRPQHRLEQRQGAGRRQRPAVAQQRAQVAAVDVLHDQVGRTGLGVASLVEDRHDLRGGQAGGRAGLAGEPRDEVGVVGERPVHHLDGDRTVEPLVDAAVDGRHPAPGEQRRQPVAVVEQAPDQRVVGLHGGRHGVPL